MYYDAADQLRVVQHTSLGPPGNTTADAGSWDEYWYDALGRRVLMRERRNDLSNDPNRRDVIDRFVWDGDQLLYEIRNPGGPGDPLDQTITSGSRFAGVVGYLHGRELDAPLAVMDSMGRVPMRNWRGLTMGTVRATGVPADCATGATGSCWQVDWPAKRVGVHLAPWGFPPVGTPVEEWRGSLLQQQVDKSGYLYQRNRYYDPKTGRFTQVDPIGIAGGVNAYGFASGDPVNFSDPFGLQCRPWPQCRYEEDVRNLWQGLASGTAAVLTAVGEFSGLSALFRAVRGTDESGNELGVADRTLNAVAAGAALVPGEAQGIKIGEGALVHIAEGHLPGGALAATKSVFSAGEDITALVRGAEGTAAVAQRGGNFERIVNAGRNIGVDRSTGKATSTYTVITDRLNNLVTAFPGTRGR